MTTLLVSAHPGHELRLHHWMEQARPDIFIITDGSGSAGIPRLQSSRRLIGRVGGRVLEGSGDLSDRRLYGAMRERDLPLFGALRRQIAQLILRGGYDEVVCDGLEGFNTSHDWCHYLVHSLAGFLKVNAFEHSLAEAEGPDPSPAQGDRHLFLDDEALARKLRAATEYPELSAEVEKYVQRWGPSAFKLEVLRPLPTRERPSAPPGVPPFYETFGEKRVLEGAYPEVIRWESHVRPLIEALWNEPPF
jgi:hypothetical protein